MSRRGSAAVLLIAVLALMAVHANHAAVAFAQRLDQERARHARVQAREWALGARELAPGGELEVEGWRLRRSARSAVASKNRRSYRLVLDAEGAIIDERYRREEQR